MPLCDKMCDMDLGKLSGDILEASSVEIAIWNKTLEKLDDHLQPD